MDPICLAADEQPRHICRGNRPLLIFQTISWDIFLCSILQMFVVHPTDLPPEQWAELEMTLEGAED